MKFDNAETCQQVIWDMRIAEAPRAQDRTVLLRLFNGIPPFDEATAEENNIQVNVNDLSGVNLLSMARRQWSNAFLKPSNFFTATPDTGPGHKKSEWSGIFTRNSNRLLKRNRNMVDQIRATGANTVLYGIGPTNWKDRRTIVPTPIPVGSLMVPSETDIDFSNLEYFAIFREYTPAQLYDLTHGPKVDPGWNMKKVEAQFEYISAELRKSPNSLAFQYMPERIAELIKQDKGYFGSDAVPTVDTWDLYFREAEDGTGWYRRVILDWDAADAGSKHGGGDDVQFLYTSGNRKYADSVSEILHCQFGDCSAYAPFKYHSVRSLGWMLWGVCELQNRLHCKFNEAVFEQLLWFFQTAGNNDLVRLKKANFEHMGVIPQGIKFLTAAERFTPNHNLIQMAFSRNRQLMSDSATTYTQDYDKGTNDTARTATETMAIVNSSQALASGILEMAYTYETFKYREMVRRLCLKDSTDKMAREFRLACLKDGIPEDMLDVEKWSIEPEQIIGGGNKTLQMATVGFLNTIRRNLPPEGQRMVDHISVEAATDQPDLAEEMAPIGQDKPISHSAHDAQLATERLLRGLPFKAPKDAIYEDYVLQWMTDLGTVVQKAMQRGLATAEELAGMMNLAQHIGQFLEVMGTNEDDKEKVTQYQDLFGQLMNHIKGLAQRLQESMKAQAGANGGQQGDPKDAAKVQAMLIQAQTKAKISENSATQRTRQKEEQFQKAEMRKDQQTAADIARDHVVTRHELMANRMKAIQDLANQAAEPEAAGTE